MAGSAQQQLCRHFPYSNNIVSSSNDSGDSSPLRSADVVWKLTILFGFHADATLASANRPGPTPGVMGGFRLISGQKRAFRAGDGAPADWRRS
jgi:hypothetical protein